MVLDSWMTRNISATISALCRVTSHATHASSCCSLTCHTQTHRHTGGRSGRTALVPAVLVRSVRSWRIPGVAGGASLGGDAGDGGGGPRSMPGIRGRGVGPRCGYDRKTTDSPSPPVMGRPYLPGSFGYDPLGENGQKVVEFRGCSGRTRPWQQFL